MDRPRTKSFATVGLNVYGALGIVVKRSVFAPSTTPQTPGSGPSRAQAVSQRPLKTLRTGDADLRFYITTVQDG